MRNKFLTTLLSLLMLFNTLPVNTVNTVIAEGEDENAIVETTPAEEETAQEDEYVLEEDPPAETGDEVLPAEPGDGTVDFVKTDDDDIFAVTVHGEAAEDPEAAVAALSEQTDLSLEEIEEIMAVTFDDGSSNEIPKSEADGTKIIGITAKWITQDTVDNGDESLLYVKPADGSDQSVKLQINYSLAVNTTMKREMSRSGSRLRSSREEHRNMMISGMSFCLSWKRRIPAAISTGS